MCPQNGKEGEKTASFSHSHVRFERTEIFVNVYGVCPADFDFQRKNCARPALPCVVEIFFIPFVYRNISKSYKIG